MGQNNVRMLSDDEIVALYWARNENAIAQTDLKYRTYLLKIANNIVRDLQDSEECLKDTYLSAWNTIPPERPYLLKAYLSTLMRNIAISLYRKQQSQKRMAQSQALSLSDLEDVLADAENTRNVQALALVIDEYLSELSGEQRYIFLGRYYYGKTISQIANELRVSQSKVNKQIAYLKQTLKQKLAKEGVRV